MDATMKGARGHYARASNVLLHTTVDSAVSAAARTNAIAFGFTARSSADVYDESSFTRSSNFGKAGVQAQGHTFARNQHLAVNVQY